MRRRLLPTTRAVVVLGGLWLWLGGVQAAPREVPVLAMSLNQAAREVEIEYRGRRLMVYAFAPSPFKPYVRELRDLAGANLLRDAPADHLHHHGLMYAIKVNDINFWEEAAGAGYQIPGPEISRRVHKDADGTSHAELIQTIYWSPVKTAPDPAATALLKEERKIDLAVDEAAGEVILEWQSDFEVGSATPTVTLAGSAYHGLGMRLVAAFDGVATRQNSAGAAYLPDGAQGVTAAEWSSMTATVGGRPVTIALFSAPPNAGPHRVFSMLKPFAYLSATQGLDEKPIGYRAGQKFALRYLVTIQGGARTAAALAARHEQWRKRLEH